MDCECPPIDGECQSMPTTGSLAHNLNASFARILEVLHTDSSSDAYAYTMTSVRSIDGTMQQCGSGPNIQGGYITLCTCKRLMRTFREPRDWIGAWIIGISGAGAGVDHAVFYMMKVQAAFESHYDLWHSDLIPADTKQAKSASKHRLGDLYEPKGKNLNPFDPGSYIEPIAKHSHRKDKNQQEWHRDIRYEGWQTKRPAALLVGDPKLSFIWETPLIYPRFQNPPRLKGLTLNEFAELFEERQPKR